MFNIAFSRVRTNMKAAGFPWRRILPRVRARKMGLRGEIMALFIISGLAILSLTALITARSLAENVQRQYNDAALSIWRVFDATYLTEADLRGPLVQEQLLRFQSVNPDIHEIRIYAPVDQRFQVVASTDNKTIGKLADLDDMQPILGDQPVWHEVNIMGESIAELAAPLHEESRPTGVLEVQFRLVARDALIRQQLFTLLIMAVLGGSLLLAAIYWELDRLVLKPLSYLQRHTAAIASGNLIARTNIRREDEVGQLALSFDRMTTVLAERQRENARLQGELRSRYEEAEQRAVLDPLTNLYNHRHFYERLSQEMARSQRFNHPLALLFCDIDHFKAVNDEYGHQAGDQVLRTVAGVLTDSIRNIDLAARYGGEEFTIILVNTTEEDAFRVAERIRSRVAVLGVRLPTELVAETQMSKAAFSDDSCSCKSQADCCHQPAEAAITATLSIGIACYPADASSSTELVQYADSAMYYAKRLGRNQAHTYPEVTDFLAAENSMPWNRDVHFFDAVQSLAAAVDARDSYTHRHSSTVSNYATALARAVGVSGAALTHIQIAGLLHDVGKIGIPDQILGKAGELTEIEWQKMREHPMLGQSIVEHLSAHEQIVPLIVHHHERWDGAGYPDGLRGKDIPWGARIISVVDAYHAMTSDRPYRKALSREEALGIIELEAGKQFDPQIVDAFLQVPEEALLVTADVEGKKEGHHGSTTANW